VCVIVDHIVTISDALREKFQYHLHNILHEPLLGLVLDDRRRGMRHRYNADARFDSGLRHYALDVRRHVDELHVPVA